MMDMKNIKKYGHLTAGQLVDLMHRANAPWTKTPKNTWPLRSEIKLEVIKEYHKFEKI